jgi:AcrR family transcriptional regulator
MAEAADHQLRRPPKQERSRERVDEILAATKKLIGEKGIDAVKMREIAALAGGPISSVYQYFPNKSAIIALLFSRWANELTEMLGKRLEDVHSADDLNQVANDLLDYYHIRIRSDRAILDLLMAVQADKALKNVDIAETRIQARMFCERGKGFVRPSMMDEFERVTFLMLQLAFGAVRLALIVPEDEAEGILNGYKAMIATQLGAFSTPEGRSSGSQA